MGNNDTRVSQFCCESRHKKAITFKNHRMRRDGISPPTDKQYAIPYQALDAVCTNGSLRQTLPLVRSKSDFRFTPESRLRSDGAACLKSADFVAEVS
jgi:hypothetical protein